MILFACNYLPITCQYILFGCTLGLGGVGAIRQTCATQGGRCWRCLHLHPAAPARSWLAAHAQPCPGRRLGQPICGGLVSLLRTVCRFQVVFPSFNDLAAGSGSPQCPGTRCRVCRCSTSGPFWPVSYSDSHDSQSQSVTHRATGSSRPQCYETRCRVHRCTASGPISLRHAPDQCRVPVPSPLSSFLPGKCRRH